MATRPTTGGRRPTGVASKRNADGPVAPAQNAPSGPASPSQTGWPRLARVAPDAGLLPSEAKPRADRNQVAKRAFALFLARGASHGRDLEDWLQAERDLAAEHRGRK